MKVKAAVAHEGDPTFRYEDVEIGPLQDNEILVR